MDGGLSKIMCGPGPGAPGGASSKFRRHCLSISHVRALGPTPVDGASDIHGLFTAQEMHNEKPVNIAATRRSYSPCTAEDTALSAHPR